MPIISEATFGTYTGYNNEFDSIVEANNSGYDFQGFGDMMMAQAINEARIFEYMIAGDYAELDAIREDAGYNTGKFGLNRKYSENPREKKSIKNRYDSWDPKNKVTGAIKKGIDAVIAFVTKWFGKFKSAIETAVGKVVNFIKPKLEAIKNKLNYVQKAENAGKLNNCPVLSWYKFTTYGANFHKNAEKLYNALGKEARRHTGENKDITYRSNFEKNANNASFRSNNANIADILNKNGLKSSNMTSSNKITKKDMVNAALEKLNGTRGGDKGKLYWSDVKSGESGISIQSLHDELKNFKSIFAIMKSVNIAKKTVKEFITSIKKREKAGFKGNDIVNNAKNYAQSMTRTISLVGSADIAIAGKRIRQSFATLMALVNYAFPGRQAEKFGKDIAGGAKKLFKKDTKEASTESAIFYESVWLEAAADFTEAVTDYYSDDYNSFNEDYGYLNESDDSDDDDNFGLED